MLVQKLLCELKKHCLGMWISRASEPWLPHSLTLLIFLWSVSLSITWCTYCFFVAWLRILKEFVYVKCLKYLIQLIYNYIFIFIYNYNPNKWESLWWLLFTLHIQPWGIFKSKLYITKFSANCNYTKSKKSRDPFL